eukprot:ANDGO_02549.mRNA.1 hypothetical protein
MQTFVSLNYVLRVCFTCASLAFSLALPLRLDGQFSASWWPIFLPLYANLLFWAVFSLDSFRKFRKAKNLDFKLIAYNLFYHGVYFASIIGISVFLSFLTQKLDEEIDRSWTDVFAPIIVVSGVIMIMAVIMFLISTLDFGSVQPIAERFNSALVSRTGYILVVSGSCFVFCLVLLGRMNNDNTLTFWDIFGVFWFIFAFLFCVFVCCCFRFTKKKPKSRSKKRDEEDGDATVTDDSTAQKAIWRKQRDCLVITMVVWIPLFCFIIFLASKLENRLDWYWIQAFIPLIFTWSLLFLWSLSNGGKRFLYDIVDVV